MISSPRMENLSAFVSGLLTPLRKIVSQWTIQREITLTIFITSLIPLSLSHLYLYSRIDALYENQVVEYSREVIHQAAANIENIAEQADIAKKQVISWTIQNHLLDTRENTEEEFQISSETSAFIQNLRINFPFLTGIDIVNENLNIYSDKNTLFEEDRELDLKEMLFAPEYSSVVLAPRIRKYLGSKNSALQVSVLNQIKDYSIGGKPGLIRLDIDFKFIQSVIEKIELGEGTDIYLYNNNIENPYVFNKEGNDIPPGILDEPEVDSNLLYKKGHIVVRSKIQDTGWSLVGVLPISVLKEKFTHIRTVSMTIVIFLSLLAVLIGIILANRITLPLTDVVDKIYRFGHGDFSQKLPHFHNHDLRILADNFNQMTSKIELLMIEAVERENEKEKAEFMALQAQINPHFLYNTLEVIRGISLKNNVPEVSSIVKSLSSIFRYSINRENEFVPLSRELDNVKNYLNIQNSRYIGRFEYSEEIPEDLKSIEVLRLLLQPVIENIFKHVVELRSETTEIGLNAREDEGYLVLTVRNNGKELSEEDITGIEKGLEGKSASSGIGLSNVHKRLCLFNCNDRGLSIGSHDGETVINLYIKRKDRL